MQTLFLKSDTRTPLWQDTLAALLCALMFSAFIYLEHYGLHSKLLNSINGLGALAMLLYLNRRSVIISGLFIGLLWFYWIGFSFSYYGFSWAVPLVSIGFGLIYALIFGTLALTKHAWLRALILFGLSFIEPMDFNWMKIELLFIESYFGIEKWQLALILFALALPALLPRKRSPYALLFLLGAIQFSHGQKTLPQLKIKLVSDTLPQELKWKPYMREPILRKAFAAIETAINEEYEAVVLPESAFVVFLNHHPDLIERLSQLSYDIDIITGALYDENGLNYNVTYHFSQGEYRIAKKIVLVPFGEYIPLPAFMREWVNRVIFGGASDYVHAENPTDFFIKGIPFRNAICYEATCEKLFKDDPEYMIAISNNAWFSPSVEPTLQTLLMRYYARRHGTVIFHCANMAGTGIVE